MPFQPRSTAKSGTTHTDYSEVWTDSVGRAWDVDIELRAFGGILAMASVTVTATSDGYHLTQQILRQMPLAEIERRAFEQERKALDKRQASRAIGPHSGRQLSNDDLAEVAEVYLGARNARVPVQQAVADHFDIAVSSAAKRIAMARRLGLIPSDTPPK